MRILIILLISLILTCCQTTRNIEKIVISDTIPIVRIDTTRIVIIDTLHIENKIDSIVFDTLYTFVDSIVVKELINKVRSGIRTTFHYDTSLVLDGNKLVNIRLNYDGEKIRIMIDDKRLIEYYKYLERVEKEEHKDWLPSLWVQIGIGVIVFLLVLCIILYKIGRRKIVI